MTEIITIPTPALGDCSYLLVSGDEAAVIDPQRDIAPVLAAAASRGATVRWALDTHVHNDYVSGAREVAAATGATAAGPAGAWYGFHHVPLVDGAEIAVGDALLRAIHTPGHTPEHTSYLLLHDLSPAVFTGGSLLVGRAGRSDLLGAEHAAGLARDQYRSVRRLAALAEGTRVLPTHGAGSFCAATSAGGGLESTVGVERATNVALLATDEHIFAREHLRGQPRYPTYYQYMAPINRRGPRVLGHFPELKPLEVEQVAARLDAGAWVVDGRDRFAFAAAHLPGSLNVELDEGFAAYVGWTVPFGAELVLVLPEPVAVTAAAAVTQLLRIGYERLAGYLAVGVAGWAAAGRHVRRYPAVAVSQLAARTDRVRLLDVRDPLEAEALPAPAALSIFVGDLPRLAADVPRDREIWTICASGRRAAIAASLLDRAGVPVTAVARGGVAELRRCAGEQPAV